MKRYPWGILGIEETENLTSIKKAFAEKAKTIHPEENAAEFMELRDAYHAAVQAARDSISVTQQRTVIIPQTIESEEPEFRLTVDFKKIEELLEQEAERYQKMAALIEERMQVNLPGDNWRVFFEDEEYKHYIETKANQIYFMNAVQRNIEFCKYKSIFKSELNRIFWMNPKDQEIKRLFHKTIGMI